MAIHGSHNQSNGSFLGNLGRVLRCRTQRKRKVSYFLERQLTRAFMRKDTAERIRQPIFKLATTQSLAIVSTEVGEGKTAVLLDTGLALMVAHGRYQHGNATLTGNGGLVLRIV